MWTNLPERSFINRYVSPSWLKSDLENTHLSLSTSPRFLSVRHLVVLHSKRILDRLPDPGPPVFCTAWTTTTCTLNVKRSLTVFPSPIPSLHIIPFLPLIPICSFVLLTFGGLCNLSAFLFPPFPFIELDPFPVTHPRPISYSTSNNHLSQRLPLPTARIHDHCHYIPLPLTSPVLRETS